MTLEFFRQIF